MYALLGSIIGSFCSSLLVSLVAGYYFMYIAQKRFAASVREYVPDTHVLKNGTPTMGGLYILCVLGINTLIWCRFLTGVVWAVFFAMVIFGLIGLVDDLLKIYRKKGLNAWQKFSAQWIFALIIILVFVHLCGMPTTLTLFGCSGFTFDLSLLFYFWAAFIMVSLSNAVNLTDGLDGLAVSVYVPVLFFYLLLFSLHSCGPSTIAYLGNNVSAMLALFTAILAGTLIGFLWYNSYPARMFMGDVGSLSLGAGLAALALFSKAELTLPIVAFVFVVEVLSVIAQVVSVKYRGSRIFRMAPVHHHFELCGMHENVITVRAAIVAVIACSFMACVVMYCVHCV